MYSSPVGPLYHRCPLCPSRSGPASQLLRCGACRAIRYCSREHQTAHRSEHKYICNEIKKVRAKLSKEEYAIRNATPDILTPANAFETEVGHFWGIVSTRDYMQARCMLAKYLCSIDTLDGVCECLEHLQDMLRLCRKDNMGNRQIIPTIMLRLDLDQECYDFMKWWATCDPHGTYDWADTSLPYLDLHGFDVLENPGWILGKLPVLEHLDALLLLKLKLLVDIRNIKITRRLLANRKYLPLELREQIEREVVRSPLSLNLQREPHESLLKSERNLLSHVRRLGAAIMKINSHFMSILFDPDEALNGEFQLYSPGSWEEAALAMQSSYATWWETEGILDLLDDARACSIQDSGNEVDDWMANEEAQKGRTLQERRSNLSLTGMWCYLDWAAENSAWLGPWSDRPSERHMRKNRENAAKSVADLTRVLADDGADSDWSDDDATD